MSHPEFIRADQLVYSNVEAEFSPVGRRGFQVWLCSPRLKEFQRDIARRIEDFTWPPSEIAAGRLTERLTFFPLASGGVVIARTVPLTERDALKRTGRFHAHALILDDAEFDRLGANPFTVFDRFVFQQSPAAGIESGLWRTGVLPDAEELPLDTERVLTEEPPDLTELMPLLARWLDGPDDPRPLALPEHPDRVADWLRTLFRHLPPDLRRKASFDTLSSGQTLTTLPYRFVGGFDTQTVRDWPYRRSYRLDAKTGSQSVPPTPPENPLLDHFSREWVTTDSVTDLQYNYRLYRAMQDSSASLTELLDIPESSLSHALAAPGADTIWSHWVTARMETDVPQPRLRKILEPIIQGHFGPPRFEGFQLLTQPIPVPQIGKWLFSRFSHESLSREIAEELLIWANEQLRLKIKDDPIPRLILIALAGSGNANELRKLFHTGESWPKLIDGWFRDWFHSRMIHAELTPVLYAQAILNDQLSTPAALQEYDILAAIHTGSTPPTEGDQVIAIANAFRVADSDNLRELLQTNSLLQRIVIPIVDRADADFVFAWGQPPYTDCPGAYLSVPFSPGAVAGVKALFTALEKHRMAAVMTRARAQECARKSIRTASVGSTACTEANKLSTAGKWDRLEKELATLTDPADFRAFLVDHLHDKARLADGDIPCQRWTLSTGEPVLWVGWRIVSNGLKREVFDKLYPLVTRVIQKDPALSQTRIAAIVSAVTSSTR